MAEFTIPDALHQRVTIAILETARALELTLYEAEDIAKCALSEAAPDLLAIGRAQGIEEAAKVAERQAPFTREEIDASFGKFARHSSLTDVT